MHPRQLLLDTTPFLAPAKTLDGLSPTDADRRVGGAPHTIAEIIAHLSFWQDWFLARAEGTRAPMPASAALGWPRQPAGRWDATRRAFADGLERVAAFAATAEPRRAVDPPLEFPTLAGYTVDDVVVHVATHNAHHLGQVVLLRQLMDRWPPPAGSWTW